VTRVPPELWPIVHRLATAREWPPRDDADTTAFFNYVNGQKLLPLLLSDDDLPATVIAAKPRFRALEFLYRKRFELARDAILELQRVLGADTFLFYKGSDYCHRLYDRPEFRPMADVDVYVPPAELPGALRKLETAGYPRKYAGHGAAFSPSHHEIPVVIGSVLVELHRGFAQRVRAAIDYDGIWRRRVWFERNGVGGYRLSPTDAILGHAYGLAKDEFTSELSRFLDFYLLLQQGEDELDQCVKRARDWQIERALFGALHVTSAMFADARTPAVHRAMDTLLDLPTRQFLIDKVLPDPTTEPSGWVSGRRIQIHRKFALIDRSWRRIAFVAHSFYATAIGSTYEWRARRRGVNIPPRSMMRPR
jgi:hypothetical protein